MISHAILSYNRGRTSALRRVVITPSHNPPEDGGYKYNPPHGAGRYRCHGQGEKQANAIYDSGLKGVARMPYERARKTSSTHLHDYINPYVPIRQQRRHGAGGVSGVNIGIDPLGGAAVHLAADHRRYGLKATIVNDAVDPTFRFFMTADWDVNRDEVPRPTRWRADPDAEKIRRRLCQRHDADRHRIVTRSGGR